LVSTNINQLFKNGRSNAVLFLSRSRSLASFSFKSSAVKS
jgi:hypothetical protein